MTSLDLMRLVDDIAENASKNPYIVKASETFQNGNYPNLQRKLVQEGRVVIPNVVTLAFVLEKMTKTMKRNWKFVKVCSEIWSEYDSLPKTVSYLLSQGNIFHLTKVLSVEQVIKRRLQTFETRDLRKILLLCQRIRF